MILRINALRYKGQSLQSPITAIFDEQGGTIGRSSSNQCVLPDEQKVVSGRHATIIFDAGCFYYRDESLNGTRYCNDDRLIRHEQIALKDQDELNIGDYDLIVTISPPQPETPPLDSNVAFQSMFANDLKDEQTPPLSTDDNVQTSDLFFPEKNPFEDQFQVGSFGGNDFGPEINESFTPPPVTPARQASRLPRDLSMDDFFRNDSTGEDFFGENDFGEDTPFDQNIAPENRVEEISQSQPLIDSQRQKSHQLTEIVDTPSIKPVQRPSMLSKLLEKQNTNHSIEAPNSHTPPPRGSAPQRAEDRWAIQSLDVFLDTIGLKDSIDGLEAQDPEFIQTVGEVFKELIDGLMMILRGRSEVKSQLRASMTVIQKTENNPLKFSPSVEEALKILLSGKSPGFISGVEAIREGFEDIKNHQLAITAGVQASLMHILKRFDPTHFEKKFEKGLDPLKKVKCWNEYSQTYQDIVQGALEDFFGQHFVNAYEAQMDKLRQSFK